MGSPRNGNGRGNGRAAPRPAGRRRRRLIRRRSRRARRVVALLLLAGAIALTLVLVAVSGGAYTAVTTWREGCSLADLRPTRLGQNSFVFAANGTLLGTIRSERNRQPVPLERMSPWLERATLAIEDRRFYAHDGLDYEGIVRAAVRNLEEGRIVEGGSTITQQLVRSLYTGDERSWERKGKEACLALELEEHWSKERILETYLNRVFFGNRAFGVQAAARTYFATSARKLGPAQAALLAGLAQAPSAYDPFGRPGAALARRNTVLRAMADAGLLPGERAERLVRRPLGLEPGTLYETERERYFFSYVRRLLVARYGEERVRSGGLRVHTTVSLPLQREARQAIRSTLDRGDDPAAAIVAVNPRSGAIRAMAAVAPGERGLQFNLAEQGRRQSGSAFKTFVLAEAVRRGIHPDRTRYLSAPFTYQPPGAEEWEVSTYGGDYHGPSTLTAATLRSDNTVYARLTVDLGPESVARLAQEMGIVTELAPVASIGLGSNSVSPLELASAYATLAAGGVYREPFAIRRVVLPDGPVHGSDEWGRGERRRVLTDGQAAAVTRILAQNMTSGTGTGAQIGRPAAGKTGTTDRFTDAWFAGYTPRLTSAVWVGYPRAAREMSSVHGIPVAGGTFPATIWGRFMGPARAGTPADPWPVPKTPPEWKRWRGEHQFDGRRSRDRPDEDDDET
jgi:penicillin-binding protein 1A